MDQLTLFVPLKKADAAQRLVYGVAAAERPDKSREIMDYATAKPAFQSWSDEIAKATDGKSLGNVRLMHSKTAIGKVTELAFNDETKEVEVCAKIVDDAAWKMVEEGVLGGFSIGGGYAKTWPDPVNKGHRRYTPALSELSLVDNPCIPGATFSLTKADGTVEEVEVKERPYEPTNEDVKTLAGEMAKAAGGSFNNFVAKARAELIKRHSEQTEEDRVIDALKVDHPNVALAVLVKAAADIVGAEAVAGGARNALMKAWKPEPTNVADPAEALRQALEKAGGSPKPYGDVEYADPKAGKYPIDTPAHIRAAWSYVNMPKNASVLGDQADAVKAKIVAAWKAKIDKAGPPSAEKCALIIDMAKNGSGVFVMKAVDQVSLEKGFYTVQRLGGAMACLSEIAQSVVYEEAWEKDTDSTLPQGMLDLVASTRSILIDMVNEETAEFMACCERDGGDFIALLAPCVEADVLEMATKLGDLHKADTGLMEKVGAKISSANMKHVQAMHDHAQAMGATCDGENCDKSAGGHLAKVDDAELATLRKLAGEAVVTIEKVASERDADRAELAEVKATLEKLAPVIELLAKQPQAPRGALFAVEKDGSVTEVTPAEKVTAPSTLAQILALPEGPERGHALLKFSGGGVAR